MIALTQKISTEVFTFKAVVAFKLLSRSFVYKQKRQQKLQKSRLLFKKITTFSGRLLQNNE